MREVGILEAEDRFGQLLKAVEQGEEVIITRDGREIARLVPARAASSQADARAALQRIRARAESRRLGSFDWAEWKAFRDEGRP